MKNAGDFMNKRVIYFSPDNTILEISEKFSEYNISGAPIVEGGRVVGLVSNSDVIKFINERLYKDISELSSTTSSFILNLSKAVFGDKKFKDEVDKIMGTKVREVMKKEVKFVSSEADIAEVVEIMTKMKINRLPVVDNGELVGIIARDDVIRAFLAEA